LALEVSDRVRSLLISSGWEPLHSAPLFPYQDLRSDDPRGDILRNLNGLTTKTLSDVTLKFFIPPFVAPDANGRTVETIFTRDLQEIQDIAGVALSDPIFFCNVDDRFSPYDIVIDKYGQFFGVGEMLVYLGGSARAALDTVLFNFQLARYVNSDGSLVDLQEKPVHESVQLEQR